MQFKIALLFVAGLAAAMPVDQPGRVGNKLVRREAEANWRENAREILRPYLGLSWKVPETLTPPLVDAAKAVGEGLGLGRKKVEHENTTGENSNPDEGSNTSEGSEIVKLKATGDDEDPIYQRPE